MIEEFDKFYPTIWETGGTSVITIPKDLMKGMGLSVGDTLIVMIRRKVD